MNFGRQKRLALGALALLVPLPLPFNQVTGWPVLLVYWVAVGLFLRRAWSDAEGWLPNWAMNVLAVAYVPIFLLDLSTLWRGRFLHPIVHLVLFLLVVKLFALRREQDKWHAMLVMFFIFLAATGTSVHPSVVLYVVAYLVMSLWLLTRFVGWEMLGRHPRTVPPSGRVPLKAFVTGGVLFSILVAVPIFVFMPRLRTPYVVGPGGGYGSATQIAGFQDVMRLDGIGRVRGSRAVVMRLTYDEEPPPTHESRIKVRTYDRFVDDEWRRSDTSLVDGTRRMMRRLRDGSFLLASGDAASWMGVWMEPFGGFRLGIPVDAVRLDWEPDAMEGLVFGRGASLQLDNGGGVTLPVPRPGMVRYRVGLAGASEIGSLRSVLEADPESALDASTVPPRVAELARQVAGEGDALERTRRIEQHLIRSYEYTLDFLGSAPGERIESFLFESRRGHCELFATAMVLMLRAEGIPARFATGFLGADFNPIEDYYIVRESNAHAWVEAHLEGAGWQVFDPTPPSGRPLPGESGLSQLAFQLYDYIIFRWDRYVLTYGLADQVGVLATIRSWWESVTGWFSASEEDTPAADRSPATTVETAAPAADSLEPPALPWWPWVALAAVAILAFLLVRRRSFTAADGYLRLRERLRDEAGAELEAWPPLTVVDRFADRWPERADPARELVALYLTESFGGRELSEEEVERARELTGRALETRRRRAA